ncbi:DUF5985 family protein [Caldimonas brevitalea]|uniref:Membrane protein n=1 Tax=Caldimonas brevitalea TaxID=413882 RepID=A0A0G3BND1_9BURK|nr:DUF5985 family protein [Caldimonas brevitalea]AKJ29498.1 membrane protein [Caldimonas brevitalea]
MNTLLMGAIAMASLVASMFFLRFWRRTGDRFFLWFALAFLIDALDRVFLGLHPPSEEQSPLFYGVRLLSFGLILVAIVSKNLRRRDKS